MLLVLYEDGKVQTKRPSLHLLFPSKDVETQWINSFFWMKHLRNNWNTFVWVEHFTSDSFDQSSRNCSAVCYENQHKGFNCLHLRMSAPTLSLMKMYWKWVHNVWKLLNWLDTFELLHKYGTMCLSGFYSQFGFLSCVFPFSFSGVEHHQKRNQLLLLLHLHPLLSPHQPEGLPLHPVSEWVRKGWGFLNITYNIFRVYSHMLMTAVFRIKAYVFKGSFLKEWWTYSPVQHLCRCSSYVGRRGNGQTVSLSRQGCIHYGTVQHELLHALGFNHEHCRSDREKHIRVLLQNIIKGRLQRRRGV